jgi:hypothetical protein
LEGSTTTGDRDYLEKVTVQGFFTIVPAFHVSGQQQFPRLLEAFKGRQGALLPKELALWQQLQAAQGATKP